MTLEIEENLINKCTVYVLNDIPYINQNCRKVFSSMHVNFRSITNENHYNKLTGILHVLHPSVSLLTEIWLRILPPFDNFIAYHMSRPNQRGGGVTLLINRILDSHDFCLNFVPKTFEYSCGCISAGSSCVI